eukprot:scaffold5164_cov102-Isochrysis_galbana.AAC.1
MRHRPPPEPRSPQDETSPSREQCQSHRHRPGIRRSCALGPRQPHSVCSAPVCTASHDHLPSG